MKQSRMIEDLKKKVFRGILFSAMSVLAVILIAYNLVAAARTFRQADEILTDAERMLTSGPGPGSDPDSGSGSGPDRKERDMRPPREGGGRQRFDLLTYVSAGDLVMLALDEDGTVLTSTDDASPEEYAAIAAYVYEAGVPRGTRDGWNYLFTERQGAGVLLLLNRSLLYAEAAETALWSLLALAAAAVVFAFLAHALTKRIVTPVEEAVNAQKRFIADASHELKTPLTVIDANAAVLEKETGENKWLGYIKEQTARMAQLVTALLTLSKLDEEQHAAREAENEAFDAAEVLTESALPFESAAYENNLSLTIDAPDHLIVSGNANDFAQIVTILVDNAVKHGSAGGEIVITIKEGAIRHGKKEEQALELTVSNPGETIPEEALKHLFERFYKADPSRQHTDDSFGLGLAILKALVEKNGGTIGVRSEGGETVFTVCLPGF